MPEGSIKKKVASGIIWTLFERIGNQGIQFIIQIVLARLLMPSDYGAVAMITVFITLATVIVQSGFGQALVQKAEIDELDSSSVFYLNLALAAVLYLILFFCAPVISRFYNMEILTKVLRVQAVILFFGAFNAVQTAMVKRAMQFKKFFYITLSSSFVQGVVGIVLAYMGFGVWSLVYATLANSLMNTIVLWTSFGWRPHLCFSFARLKTMFGFGSKLLVSNLIDSIYGNIYTLVIGKLYSSTDLGYYNRGHGYPSMVANNINGSLQSVLFPAFSTMQDNRQRLKSMMRRSIMTSTFVIFPAMMGLAVIAEPMVRLMLTEKWMSCVPFLQLTCISCTFSSLRVANIQAITAIGRSDVILKLEIIKKTMYVILLIISIPFGIYWMMGFRVMGAVLEFVIAGVPNNRLLQYSVLEQVKDVAPSMLLTLVMGAAAYSITFLHLGDWPTLLLQVFTGVVAYVAGAQLCRMECFRYIKSSLKEMFQKKKA